MAATMADGMDADTAGRWLSYAELAEIRSTDKHSALKLALRKRWPRRKDNHGIMQVCVPPEWLGEWARKPSGVAPDVALPMAPAMADGASVNSIIVAFEAAAAALTKRAEAAETRADGLQQERDAAHKRADVAVALADRTLAQLAEANTERAAGITRAERAEALVTTLEMDGAAKQEAITEERSRADAAQIAQAEADAEATELRGRLDVAKAQVASVTAQLADEAKARDQAEERSRGAREEVEALRQTEKQRRGQGRWARLRAAWLGE
jgi:hypothetical protein